MNQISLNHGTRRAVAMVLYAACWPVAIAFGTWLGHLMMPSPFAITVAATAAAAADFAMDLVAYLALPARQVRSR